MQVMLLCGSTAEKSHTRALVRELSDALQSLEMPAVTWDLRQDPLPIADPDLHSTPEKSQHPNVRRFVKAARQSDAFAVASPLYHGSFSGAIKNALDHLSQDTFKQKPIALLSHGACVRKCSQPCADLLPVISAMLGVSLTTQVSTTNSDYEYNADGHPLLSNAVIRARVKRQGQELIDMMKLLRTEAGAA